MDRHPVSGADVVCDLDRYPWPLSDSSFARVHLYDVLEHLADPVRALEEVYRIAHPDGEVRITVPHFSCANAYTDPTHKTLFGRFSLDYFTRQYELAYYSSSRFRIRHASIVFHPTLLNKVISRLANRYPERWERRWCWISPAWFLYFELEVSKS